MANYPIGYVSLKRQVRPGNSANACPSCEADTLRKTLNDTDERPYDLDRKSERRSKKFAQELQEDIKLLTTGNIETVRHIRNALKVYGDLMTRDQRGNLERRMFELQQGKSSA